MGQPWVVPVVLLWLATAGHANLGRRGKGHRTSIVRELYLETVKLSVSGTLLLTDQLEPGVGDAKTVGHKRLDNIRALLEKCMRMGTPGDFVECGVWRGGASIFAKAVLTASPSRDRKVVLVDSFMGLPEATHELDNDIYSKMDYLRVSQPEVAANFERYGLLDEDVLFFKGFFNTSAPELAQWYKQRQRSIAVLRLDGDMYVSLMDCLQNLYDLVSPGGFVIIDDWQIPEAVQAVNDFQATRGIVSTIVKIDGWSVFWQKI